MMHDEGRLDRLPVCRKARSCGGGSFRRFSAGQRIRFLIVRCKLSGLLVEGAHLDAGPEAAEGEPGSMRGVFNVVGVDGVEVVGGFGFEDETFVLPLVVRAGGVERLVGRES